MPRVISGYLVIRVNMRCAEESEDCDLCYASNLDMQFYTIKVINASVNVSCKR